MVLPLTADNGRDRAPIAALLAVLALAVAMRWLGYTGFFGSDEVTYTERAFRIVQGDWSVDPYVGANRLGVNLPVAAFGALLGRTEFAAALWSLLCSVAEVGLVAWLGWRMFGARAGVMAGLLLASMPTHVHFAGRLMADAPLALAISAAFAFFYEGERRRWPLGWFLAGVCAGLSFWVKPVTLFVFGIFAFWPWVARRIDWRWLWMPVGAALAMAANGLLFWALTGRFWYIFEVMHERRSSGYLEAGASAGDIAADPHFYLVYLFGKVYHTGLIGFLALLGAVVLLRRARNATRGRAEPGGDGGLATRFLLFWALGLVLVLSVLPVGFDPLVLVPKQTNYMLIFAAPLAVLAGAALAALADRWSWRIAGAATLVGLGFALLLQLNVAVFVANSRATLEWVKSQPSATPVYLMQNAWRLALFDAQVAGVELRPRVRAWRDMPPGSGAERWVVLDAQSWEWERPRPAIRLEAPPACWQFVTELRGEPQGAAAASVRPLLRFVIPRVPRSVAVRLQRLVEPLPARVYRLPAGC